MSDPSSFAPPRLKRVAFISTRIAGTDGVSLEIEKWAHVLERNGLECFYIAGELDRAPEKCALIEEAHFVHPEIRSITDRAFCSEVRTTELTEDITRLTDTICRQLHDALDRFDIDGIIVENALTIPMNIPLGVALVHVIQERGIGCIAHHHDFRWERERFLINAVDDLLHYAFPPALPQIQHVVINSLAGEEFSRRTGRSCRIIPNVMDFANPPPPPDDYAREFKREIGLADDDLMLLQPTRVVKRKGIEHAIELVRRLEDPRAKLVITHSIKDEGDAYARYIVEFAGLMDVDVVFAEDHIAESRGTNASGRKLFTLEDTYSQADLVTYPSEYEGFGNAFLEALYYKKPVLCNRYAIYRSDIEPCGFETILFDGFLTKETVEEVRRSLTDGAHREAMADLNYRIAAEFFGYEVIEDELRTIIRRPHNLYRALGRNKARRAMLEQLKDGD